jgi:hypothetical protein
MRAGWSLHAASENHGEKAAEGEVSEKSYEKQFNVPFCSISEVYACMSGRVLVSGIARF